MNAAVAAVAPNIKFLGLGLANIQLPHPITQGQTWCHRGDDTCLDYFTYFLNKSNHAQGAVLPETIDYHWYANCTYTNASTFTEMFTQADEFVETVREIEAVRKRISPKTKTFMKELGTIALAPVMANGHSLNSALDPSPLPDLYWSASAAYWAYLYARLALQKIDVVSMSQLVGGAPNCATPDGGRCAAVGGYGSCVCSGDNYPSVTMLQPRTGRPTARYHVLRMLAQGFGSRLKRLVNTTLAADVAAMAFAQGFEVTENDGSKAKKLL
eukprot:SAG11_NODE_3161_length_2642_cov_2.388124_4_plen_269_part_01